MLLSYNETRKYVGYNRKLYRASETLDFVRTKMAKARGNLKGSTKNKGTNRAMTQRDSNASSVTQPKYSWLEILFFKEYKGIDDMEWFYLDKQAL